MPNTKYLYKDIFKLSKEIELLIQLESFDKVDMLLDKREILVRQIDPADFAIGEINEIADQIKALDEKNFAQITSFRASLGKRIGSLSKNIKCVSMYKIENTYASNTVDRRN